MPNLATNILSVSGTQAEIARFFAEITKYPNPEEEFSIIENILPPPPTTLSSQWFYQNWGTKWSDSHGQIISQSETSLELKFTTANEPPLIGFTNISKLYPDLRFILLYDEGDTDTLGGASFVHGQMTEEIEREYPNIADAHGDKDFESISRALITIREEMHTYLKESME